MSTRSDVSWVVPPVNESDHPPSTWADGQHFLTSVIDDVMDGPQWAHAAIFVAWDDWGGFYDHKLPPVIDTNGYGIRVPGMVISPYAKRCYIDGQTLSFDAYNRFIGDAFLGGQRIDSSDGRPDPRGTSEPIPRETAVAATPGIPTPGQALPPPSATYSAS